jgi:hypothetical protein
MAGWMNKWMDDNAVGLLHGEIDNVEFLEAGDKELNCEAWKPILNQTFFVILVLITITQELPKIWLRVVYSKG